jgi:protein TonB
MILAAFSLVTFFTNPTPTPSPEPICRPATTLIEAKTIASPAPTTQPPCVSTELKVAVDTSQGVPSELKLVPSPSPAPSTACDREAVPAPIVLPDYPDAARGRKLGDVYADVVVQISAKGKVTGAKVKRSSGDPDVDKAAVDAARKSMFLPKLVHCLAVPGSYILHDVFYPEP